MTHQPIRVVFYGTSSFAVPTLENLAQDKRFLIVGVITQPDRPVGRTSSVQAPPMKVAAERLGLPVYQFEQIKAPEAIAVLQTIKADLAVVASFGQIISQAVLDLYPRGAINIHPSLLPKYRGPTPFLDPILNGDQKTGVSIIKMDALMDHGPLLKQIEEPIHADDTGASLGERLWQHAAKILPDILIDWTDGNIILQEQDHTQATKTRILSREDGWIDWSKSAIEIERMIRAYIPWPGTYTIENGKRFKIGRASLGPAIEGQPGTTFTHEEKPGIYCGKRSSLLLEEVQPEGKKMMEGKIFLRGCREWNQRLFSSNHS